MSSSIMYVRLCDREEKERERKRERERTFLRFFVADFLDLN
jgi:hypothetical protein